MKKILIFSMLALVIFSSCNKNDSDKISVFKGPVVQFQGGKAWTWYQVDGNNKPLRLAISIDDKALATLDRSTSENGAPAPGNNVTLKFHPKVDATPFKHVFLDWNPHGHEPDMIYGLPHFDFHFYMTSEADRLAIPPYEVDPTKFLIQPAHAYFPPTYFNPGGGVPQMGVHWLDGTSPELNGQTFTQTFIFGSYDGKVTFYEPMITEAFIKANPSFERSIPQPSKFQASGYYPTTMRLQRILDVTNIILEDFIYRTAS